MSDIYTLSIREIMQLRKGKVKRGPKYKLSKEEREERDRLYRKNYYKENKEKRLKYQMEYDRKKLSTGKKKKSLAK